MCSELFRIPLQLAGVPLFGAGALLAAWIAISGWIVWRLPRDAHWSANLRGHLVTMLGVAALLWFLPAYFPQGVPIRGYGLMVLGGSMLGIAMAIYRARRHEISDDVIMGLALSMFVGGILGARLFYVIEYWETRICQRGPANQIDWMATLKAALSYTEGGLVVYGAFLGAMGAFFLYCRRHRLPGLAIADLIAPSLVAALALGRVGCLLNGCCYGGPSELPWAITFPRYNAPDSFSMPYSEQAAEGIFHGLELAASTEAAAPLVVRRVWPASAAQQAGVREGQSVLAIGGKEVPTLSVAHQLIFESFLQRQPLRITTADHVELVVAPPTPPARSRPVHPTQIYSTINAALLAWVLWTYYPLRRRDGQVVALMLLWYPIARFLLEAIRIDEAAVFGTGLSISQNISLVMLVVSATMWWRLGHQPGESLALGTAQK
jgi:phosphatidylglycerol:prolipoprotein diacylglycerol transferase